MVLQILIHHLVLPVSFIAWLWVERPHSLARWMSTGLLVGGYLLFIVLVGAWWWIGYPLRVLFPILFGIALAVSHRRARAMPLRAAPSWKSRLDTGFRTLMGALFLFMSAGALAGYRLDAEAVELQFPMNEGVYAVGHGGSRTLVNYHVVHRSQRYALDIVRLNALGLRARGLLPRELDRYVIFGDTVRSPCVGRVVYARDSLPDLTPPRGDEAHPTGNSVAVECSEQRAVVYLAHLQRGSVRVSGGDRVRAGEPIGLVGNSGNTSEPHLHVHAERGPYTGTPSGQPGVPMRFDGRFLVRGSLVRR